MIYGPQNVDVQEGSHWAVNLASLEHGWSLLGRRRAARPDHGRRLACRSRSGPPAIEGYAFEPQFGMNLACISGDDKGLEVIYKNNSSLGYKKAFDQLLADIRARYVVDQQFYWPVIELNVLQLPPQEIRPDLRADLQDRGRGPTPRARPCKPTSPAPWKPPPQLRPRAGGLPWPLRRFPSCRLP